MSRARRPLPPLAICCLALTFLATGCRSPEPAPTAREAPAGEADPWTCAQWREGLPSQGVSLRGVSVAGRAVWISGAEGHVTRSLDGEAWLASEVPDSGELDFRDVDAFGDGTAYLMSAGPGEASRILKTTDGGESWSLQFTNPHPEGFLDGMAFWDAERGVVYGDPVAGTFFVLRTEDGGATWQRADDLPPALDGEAGFAASGTGIAVVAGGHAWFGSGGGAAARVFRSSDYGRTWQVADTPMLSGPSAGIFSLAFNDPLHGVAVGGDYQQPAAITGNAATTDDGGITWTLVEGGPPSGYRSAVAYVPGRGGHFLVTVGTSGTDLSRDGGRTWDRSDNGAYNALAFGDDECSAWSVGPEGRVGRFSETPPAGE